MKKFFKLKPLFFIIVFNYFVIIFGTQFFYFVQINIERILRSSAPRVLVGIIQTAIGLSLILLWIFVWLKFYKYLFNYSIREH